MCRYRQVFNKKTIFYKMFFSLSKLLSIRIDFFKQRCRFLRYNAFAALLLYAIGLPDTAKRPGCYSRLFIVLVLAVLILSLKTLCKLRSL
jgi:hypothetical protein